jgi:hypothetical protein
MSKVIKMTMDQLRLSEVDILATEYLAKATNSPLVPNSKMPVDSRGENSEEEDPSSPLLCSRKHGHTPISDGMKHIMDRANS